MQGIEFPTTNESLDAIIEGLNPKQNDTILAVAGSGDQAFACLEHSSDVTAVDYNQLQLELVSERAEALRLGDYDAFLAMGTDNTGPLDHLYMEQRNRYFTSVPSRLERIRGNLIGLSIEKDDIMSRAMVSSDSKIYLSNVIGFYGDISDANIMQAPHLFEELEKRLSPESSIYMADGRSFFSDCAVPYEDPGLVNTTLLTGTKLKFDVHKSYEAKKFEESYDPIVLTKM